MLEIININLGQQG